MGYETETSEADWYVSDSTYYDTNNTSKMYNIESNAVMGWLDSVDYFLSDSTGTQYESPSSTHASQEP